MLSFGASGYAAPAGGVVSAGSASIAASAAKTTITQSSQNVAINWQSFSIAAGEAVQFVQPNSSSVALNRVLGSDPSEHPRQPVGQRQGVPGQSERHPVRQGRR